MKKTITLMLGIVLITTLVNAQNLVYNPGFEDVDPTTYTVLSSGKQELMRTSTFQDVLTQISNPTLASAVDISAGGIWLKRHVNSGYFKTRVIDTDAHAGANSVNMFIPAGSTQTNMQYWYGLTNYQKIITPLSNSKKYKATVWAKVDGTEGNVCDKMTLFLTDNTKKAEIKAYIDLTGGTTWTKYEAIFDIPAFVAIPANATADFSTAFFGCGIPTTYTDPVPPATLATTNYSGILLDDYSLIEDTTTSLKDLFLNGNPFIISNKNITSTIKGKVDVFSLSGIKIITKKVEIGENIILPTGIYFLQLSTSNGNYRQKIVL